MVGQKMYFLMGEVYLDLSQGTHPEYYRMRGGRGEMYYRVGGGFAVFKTPQVPTDLTPIRKYIPKGVPIVLP